MSRIPILAVALVLVAAASADAATVSVRTGSFGRGIVVYNAAKQERNDVRIELNEGSRVVVSDRGTKRLRAGRGCRARGAHRVGCSLTSYSLNEMVVYTRDRDDRVDAQASDSPLRIFGGRGTDELLGSPRADKLNGGGGGQDTIHGGAGRDRMRDGDVERRLDSDTLDGGRGFDRIVYDTRESPVVVDLEAGVGGADGEEDVLRSFDRADGGAGDDVLTGNSKRNRLVGGPGDDVMRGGGEADRLDLGPGADTAEGGPGDDVIIARYEAEREGHSIDCGDGADDASGTHPDDLLVGCEKVQPGEIVWVFAGAVTVGRDSVTFQARCPGAISCDGRMTLSSGGRTLASDVPFRVPDAEENARGQQYGPIEIEIGEEAAAQLAPGARLRTAMTNPSTENRTGGFTVIVPEAR